MGTTSDAEIGNYIRAQRLDKGLSIRQVTDRTGLHRNTITNLESGRVTEAGTIDAVMRALGLPPLAMSRHLTGKTALVSALAVAWFAAAPDTEEAQDHAVQLLVQFFGDHPRGGSVPAARRQGVSGGQTPTLFASTMG